MFLNHNMTAPGEHCFTTEGLSGAIEGIFLLPKAARTDFIVILGHPHSLQGGSMHNKVVTTMARLFRDLAIPSIRFNFRGVGGSGGQYDAGIGESEDMLAITKRCQAVYPEARMMFAGFSFGSYVAYRAAIQYPCALLVMVAPPVHHFNYTAFPDERVPVIIVQGEDDDVVPPALVETFAVETLSSATILRFSETGHFFHRRLSSLKVRLTEAVRAQVPDL